MPANQELNVYGTHSYRRP